MSRFLKFAIEEEEEELHHTPTKKQVGNDEESIFSRPLFMNSAATASPPPKNTPSHLDSPSQSAKYSGVQRSQRTGRREELSQKDVVEKQTSSHHPYQEQIEALDYELFRSQISSLHRMNP